MPEDAACHVMSRLPWFHPGDMSRWQLDQPFAARGQPGGRGRGRADEKSRPCPCAGRARRLLERLACVRLSRSASRSRSAPASPTRSPRRIFSAEEGQADTSPEIPLRFLPGELFVPSAVIQTEVREVFRTDLEAALQMDNPGIDFSHQWAVFYALAGTKPESSRGARAHFDRVSLSLSGLTIKRSRPRSRRTATAARTGPAVRSSSSRSRRPTIRRRTRGSIAPTAPGCAAPTRTTTASRSPRSRPPARCARATRRRTPRSAPPGSRDRSDTIIINGRTWPTLAAVASTLNIGPATMEKLRALGASYSGPGLRRPRRSAARST